MFFLPLKGLIESATSDNVVGSFTRHNVDMVREQSYRNFLFFSFRIRLCFQITSELVLPLVLRILNWALSRRCVARSGIFDSSALVHVTYVLDSTIHCHNKITQIRFFPTLHLALCLCTEPSFCCHCSFVYDIISSRTEIRATTVGMNTIFYTIKHRTFYKTF